MTNIKMNVFNMSGPLFIITFILGLISLGFLFLFGFAAAVTFLYPLLLVFAALSVAAFFLLILPLSLISSLRLKLAGICFALSYVVGACAWMYAFLVLWAQLKWLVILFLFIFKAVIPVALLGLAFIGDFQTALGILLSIGLAYAMRLYALWLAGGAVLTPRRRKIETDTIDVEGHSE